MTDKVPDVVRSPAAGGVVAPPWKLVPAPIADAGDQASLRCVEFFSANVRNPKTRLAAHGLHGRLAWQ